MVPARAGKDCVNVWAESSGHEDLTGPVVGGSRVASSSRLRIAGMAPDKSEQFAGVTIGRYFGCGRRKNQ